MGIHANRIDTAGLILIISIVLVARSVYFAFFYVLAVVL